MQRERVDPSIYQAVKIVVSGKNDSEIPVRKKDTLVDIESGSFVTVKSNTMMSMS